ncbi:MAG: CPBP family intramembrane metalloprotease [Chlamydiia bacterium]|nr:CPBP family intramembrane metalloprotease [Chlamydiia bacterium]
MIQQILLLLGLAILSFCFLLIGKRNGLFSLPASTHWFFPIRWYHVVFLFAFYFFVVGFIAPLILLALKKLGIQFASIEGAVWVNFLSSLLIFLFIGSYLIFLPKEVSQQIWRQKKGIDLFADIKFGALIWLVSFPLVIFSNQLFEFFLHELFHIPVIPEQLAVRFLKMTFHTPLHFFLTSMTIAVFAPFIEEILFRGFLQSFIRQHLSVNHSIVITALCFSIFHYTPEQGIANLSIISSLFILALFLGYTYDRRRSLAAPIALHAIFNTVNIANLYLFEGFPKL